MTSAPMTGMRERVKADMLLASAHTMAAPLHERTIDDMTDAAIRAVVEGMAPVDRKSAERLLQRLSLRWAQSAYRYGCRGLCRSGR